MAQHFLISVARRSVHIEQPKMPDAAEYLVSDGFWKLSGEPLVSLRGSPFGAMVSKKEDQETGEDRKGE